MEFPRPSKSASELIGGLKDKLGFGNGREVYDDYEEQPYDEYAPYEAPYDERYDEPYDAPGMDAFDETGDYVSSRSQRDQARDRYDRLEYTTRFSAKDKGRSVSANLVNSEDLRAAAVRASREAAHPAPQRTEAPDPIQGFDVPVSASSDFVSPYQSQGASARPGASRSGSTGLDSLFTPTAASSVLDGTREISVISPQSYEDVSSVAPQLRKGAIVVLSLRATDESLRRRVLDFSFGVASALDAKVERLAGKTFAIATGQKLSAEEREALRAQRLL